MDNRVSPSNVLRSAPDALIEIGPATDGLPLVLWIRRWQDPNHFVGPIAASVGQKREGPYSKKLANVASGIKEVLLEWAIHHRIWTDIGPEISGKDVYVTNEQITGILETNLMTKLLGPVSPLELQREHSGQDFNHPTTQVRLQSEEPQTSGAALKFHGERTTCLAIALDDGTTRLARFTGARIPSIDRFVTYESLKAFESACYSIKGPGAKALFSGSLQDSAMYRENLTKLYLADVRRLGSRAIRDIIIEIDRNEIARLLCDVAARLESFHERGVVHGDIKPSNLLVTENGPELIDALEVPAGTRSPACSPGWGAPEQVLGKPVSPATDVYPVGQMFCTLLKAVVYGHVANYVVAIGESRKRLQTLYQSPEIYLDREENIIPLGGIIEWQKFLQRCLAFDASQRPGSAVELAGEVGDLIEKYPVNGTVKFTMGGPGRLEMLLFPDGQELIARMVGGS